MNEEEFNPENIRPYIRIEPVPDSRGEYKLRVLGLVMPFEVADAVREVLPEEWALDIRRDNQGDFLSIVNKQEHGDLNNLTATIQAALGKDYDIK